jgi:hypothetical protein
MATEQVNSSELSSDEIEEIENFRNNSDGETKNLQDLLKELNEK